MIQLKNEDALNSVRKADDGMGFGNGMDSSPKHSADAPISELTPSTTNPAIPVSIPAAQNSQDELRSPLERKEIEFKNRELSYQKKKLLKVLIFYLRNSLLKMMLTCLTKFWSKFTRKNQY